MMVNNTANNICLALASVAFDAETYKTIAQDESVISTLVELPPAVNVPADRYQLKAGCEQSDKTRSDIDMGDRYGRSIWEIDMRDRTSIGCRCKYRYGIWVIDLAYGISIWSSNISIWSFWISIWDMSL
jgi:hypothetical protein